MNFNLEKDFLPVGSIVGIRFNNSKFMILGFGTKDANTGRIYDYSAVEYPIGLISLNKVAMFNRDMVKKLYYVGYQSEEEQQFKGELIAAMKKAGYNI